MYIDIYIYIFIYMCGLEGTQGAMEAENSGGAPAFSSFSTYIFIPFACVYIGIHKYIYIYIYVREKEARGRGG